MTDKQTYLAPSDLKKLAIATITSALAARQQTDADVRHKQFSDEFLMLVDDITGTDLFRLTSLLADLGASIVEQLAHVLGSDSDKVMEYLAQQMLGTPMVNGDGETETENE